MGKSISNQQTDQNLIDYGTSFWRYYNQIVQLAVSMFKWENLPDTVDERFLEMGLFDRGQMLFFEDEELGFLCLNFNTNGELDVYRRPVGRHAYAANKYQTDKTEKDSVIIYNNYTRTPSIWSVRQYAQRLTDLERAIDVNCKAQKTPVMILCDENQRLSMQNLYAKYEGNYPFIFGEKTLNPNSVKALVTGAPFVADRLYMIKMQIWNEIMTELGISNVSYQKKERLLSNEISTSMGSVVASRYSRLEMRRTAAKEINKMFGLNIEVNFRDDFEFSADDEGENDMSAGGNDDNSQKGGEEE